MKGLMVTLLMMCTASFACGQQSANNAEGGKFVLRLTDSLIEDLKVNPGGLSAMIDPKDQGKITEVLILYKPPATPATPVTKTATPPRQQQVVGRQDFNTRSGSETTSRNPFIPSPSQSTSRPQPEFETGITPRTPRTPRTMPSFSLPENPQAVMSGMTGVSGNDEPIPGRDWLPVGDYTDFVPVTRRENWIREIPSGVNPTFQARVDSDFQNFRNNNLNARIPGPDQFRNVTQLPSSQPGEDRMEILQLRQEYEQKMQQYELQFAEQNRQLEQQRKEMEYQQNLNARLYANNNNNQSSLPSSPLQNYGGLNNYVQRSPQPNTNPHDMDQVMAMAQAVAILAKDKEESESYAERVARLNNDRAIANATIPGRRIANNTAGRQRPPSLNVQIPGPQNQMDGNENSSLGSSANNGSTFRGTRSELVANLSSLKKTNGFLLFMLLCSVGINVYLGLISRNFYTRYAELADELRETFTATM